MAIPNYLAYDGGMYIESPGADLGSGSGFSGPGVGFAGISQLDVRGLQSGYSAIPPDTMAAKGSLNQIFETSNGAYAVYDTSGNKLAMWADGVFWQNAGQPDAHFANGDSRVLFDTRANRWVIESFGTSTSQIQIAVSDTANALGTWHSVSFTGFDDGAGTGIADYPTLGLDNAAPYIGTNNYSGSNQCLGGSFCGTTMNVISRQDIFAAGGPKVTSLKQYTNTLLDYLTVQDAGFSLQGVNQVGGHDTGQVMAIGAEDYGGTLAKITNPGKSYGSIGATALLDPNTAYNANNPASQPNQPIDAIDTLDDRFSSAVWEYKGKIYGVHTITPADGNPNQVSYLQWYVFDAATQTVVQEGLIGDGTHSFYQGAIAINKSGQVVIAYNESGSDMNVSILAQVLSQAGGGTLALSGNPYLLKTSPIGDYHNGSVQSADPNGRQRWGDYAQVTIDPSNEQSFWIIGEYALGYLPNANTSLSRWGTWISNLDIAPVPEPSAWAMMTLGLGLMGAGLRRRRAAA